MSQITPSQKTGQADPLAQVRDGGDKPSGHTLTVALPPPHADTQSPDYARSGIPALAVPELGGLSLEQLVQAIGVEGRQQAVKQGLEAIRAKGEEIKELNAQKMEEVQKQLANLKKQEKLSPFLKAFKWIGMVLGAIASVATLAAGAVTGNPLLIAGGVVALTMSVNSMVSEGTGGKVSIGAGVAAIAKSCGASENVAKWIGFGFEMAVTLVGVGLSLGGGFASTVSQASATAAKVTRVISVATTIVSGANSVAQGAMQIASAVYDYKIAQAKAELKDLEAIMERVRTAMESEEDFLEATMEKIQKLLGAVKDMVQEHISAKTAILTSGTPSMA